MYYNLKTNKIVEDSNLLAVYGKLRKNDQLDLDVTFEQFCANHLVENGGTYVRIEMINTRPDVLIGKYAKEINVKLKGRVHAVKQTNNGSINLYEDKAGSQFWLNRVTGEVKPVTLCAAQCF